jgi:phosphoribosylanthranilate isomerase
MKIKVCGITNIEDAQLCCNLGADAIGFIFYEKSKRYIAPEKVKKIIKQLPPFVIKVGVFVNEKPEVINRITKDTKLNLVQLHGEETAGDIYIIDLPVIKAFRINDNFDFSLLSNYKNCSFLLDAFDINEYGGTGKKFLWNNIPNEIKNKIILAGGIKKEDLRLIFRDIKPYAIDVSSSLELKPGEKDKEKVKLFFDEYIRVINGK